MSFLNKIYRNALMNNSTTPLVLVRRYWVVVEEVLQSGPGVITVYLSDVHTGGP